MATPFEKVEAQLYGALTGWAPLVAIVPADRIVRFSRDLNILATTAPTELRPLIVLFTGAAHFDLHRTADDAAVNLDFVLAMYRAGASTDTLLAARYRIFQALLKFFDTQSTLPSLVPMQWLHVGMADAVPERISDVPVPHWHDAIGLNVEIVGNRTTILADT